MTRPANAVQLKQKPLDQAVLTALADVLDQRILEAAVETAVQRLQVQNKQGCREGTIELCATTLGSWDEEAPSRRCYRSWRGHRVAADATQSRRASGTPSGGADQNVVQL